MGDGGADGWWVEKIKQIMRGIWQTYNERSSAVRAEYVDKTRQKQHGGVRH